MADFTPSSRSNRAIVVRFEEENEQIDWSDSDVSESERENVLGELRELKTVTSSSEPVRNADAARALQSNHGFDLKRAERCSSRPLHMIFVIDTSASMKRRDVGRKRRLDAVLFACRDFVDEQRRNLISNNDTYTMVSFSSGATVHFVHLQAGSARERLDQIRKDNEVEPIGESRFSMAFEMVRSLLGRGHKDVQVVFLSDGRPHELNKVHSLIETKLLHTLEASWLESFLIHTIGFGDEDADFVKYLKPLSEKTGGLFQVAKLNESDLTRVFTSVASSLSSGRSTAAVTIRSDQIERAPFDPDMSGRKCGRVCDILQWKKNRKGAGTSFKEFQIRLRAEVAVEQIPFDNGAMRLVYNMTDSHNRHQDGQIMDMVAKRVHGIVHAEQELMMPFCKNTAMAISYRGSFVEAINKARIKSLKLFFVPCYMYRYKALGMQMYFVGEQRLDGDFIKFNSNNGYVNAKHPNSELVSAFSHFTFVKSRGKYIVVDLQGVVDRNTILLTDPQVVSREPGKHRPFGCGDIGFEGIRSFFAAHRCGDTCHALNLAEKQDMLEKELQVEQRRCKVCMDAASKTKLEPCGHSVVCEACALQLLQSSAFCPVCRRPIAGYANGTFSSTYVKPNRH